MSVESRIPVDRTSGKYKRDWHSTQAEQVSNERIEGDKQSLNVKMYCLGRL